MKIRFFAVAVLLLGCCTMLSAADFMRVDMNFYSEDQLIPAGKLPNGIAMPPRVKFLNPKLKGYAYGILINLEKKPEFEIKFAVSGEQGGKLTFSCMPCRRKDGKIPEIECLEFEINGESSAVVPCTVNSWRSMGQSIYVSGGDIVTLRAKFKSR